MECVVLRPFGANGTTLKVGEIVDVSGWRNSAKLIDQRYIKPAPNVPFAESEKNSIRDMRKRGQIENSERVQVSPPAPRTQENPNSETIPVPVVTLTEAALVIPQTEDVVTVPIVKRRGRPAGSKNKSKGE